MIWVAVLMLATPAMILATVNLGRAWQGYRALRLATDAACQAAAEGGLDAPVFQYMGEAVIEDYRARLVGRAVFLQVLQPYLGKTLKNPQISFRFQGLARVSCDGRAVVIPFGDLALLTEPPAGGRDTLPPWRPPKIPIRDKPGNNISHGIHLRVVTESWLRASPLH